MRNMTFPNKPNYMYHATVNWVKRNLPESEQIPRSVLLEIVDKFKFNEFLGSAEKLRVIAQREEAMLGKYREHMNLHPMEERFHSEVKAMADTLDEHFDSLIITAENSSQVLAGLASIYTVDTLHEYVQGIQSDKKAKQSERDNFINDILEDLTVSDTAKHNLRHRFNCLFN